MKNSWLSWHSWLLSASSVGVAIPTILKLNNEINALPSRLGVQSSGGNFAIQFGIYLLVVLLVVAVSGIPFFILSTFAKWRLQRKLSALADITDAMIDLTGTVCREFGREATYDEAAKERLQESVDRVVNAIRQSYAGIQDSSTDVFQARVSTLLDSVHEHGKSEALIPINRNADSGKARKAVIVEAGWGLTCVLRLLAQLFGTVSVSDQLAVRIQNTSGS